MGRASTRNDTQLPQYMTAEDHHIQDAVELFVPWHLQSLAEQDGLAAEVIADDLRAEYEQALAKHGHTPASIRANSQHRTYHQNAETATRVFYAGLQAKYPDASFVFRQTGKSGRLERRKGDFDVEVHRPSGLLVHRTSWKNYSRGINRIQTHAATFQSFALSFLLDSPKIGTFVNPLDNSECRSSSKDFRAWRDDALAAIGYGKLVAPFRELDALADDMRALLLGDEFRFYQNTRYQVVRREVGLNGAKILHQILTELPIDAVHARLVHITGFDGGEDLLVVGGSKIADSITDDRFARVVHRLKDAQLRFSRKRQNLNFEFFDTAGVILPVQIPCTINANGAWWRPRERFVGKRLHEKEGVGLAWGERRPKKSREIATSINTYVNLRAAGVLRDLPKRPQKEQ